MYSHKIMCNKSIFSNPVPARFLQRVRVDNGHCLFSSWRGYTSLVGVVGPQGMEAMSPASQTKMKSSST